MKSKPTTRQSNHYEVELDGRIVALFQPHEPRPPAFTAQTSAGPIEYARPEPVAVGSIIQLDAGPEMPLETPIPRVTTIAELEWCENESAPARPVHVRVMKVEGSPDFNTHGFITEGLPYPDYHSGEPGHEHVVGKVTVERVAGLGGP